MRFFLSSFLLLVSCVNPTKRIRPFVETFKSEHPDRIRIASGVGYAWNGDQSKRPLVFVHGSPGSWEGWAEFLLNDDLKRQFHVIALDRPGYGATAGGVSEGSLERQAEAILKVLRENHSGLPAILVGHSYGGAVIARVAMDEPRRVAGLVFVASSVDPSLEESKWYQYPASWWPFRALIPADLRVCNEEIFALKGELDAIDSRWSQIEAATVTIQGTADTLVPPANQDFLVRKLGTHIKRVTRVPNMNHFVPWEHPELILEGITEIARGL